MSALKKMDIALALSQREVLKYSVTARKMDGEYLKSLGTVYYRPVARSSSQIIATLIPTDKSDPRAVTMQFKDGGQAHMEFPVKWTCKPPVGFKGKACRTELHIFACGSIQLRKPSTKALLKAQVEKEFNESGVVRQLRLI